ncbi:hypothetical protein HK405_015499, partial [Cladochytrium tenue]
MSRLMQVVVQAGGGGASVDHDGTRQAAETEGIRAVLAQLQQDASGPGYAVKGEDNADDDDNTDDGDDENDDESGAARRRRRRRLRRAGVTAAAP